MPLDFNTELAYFKSNQKFFDYTAAGGTLGSLESWLREAWDDCENLHRFEVRGMEDRMSHALNTYMTPRRIDDSFNVRVREIERDLACVLKMIERFGEKKSVHEMKTAEPDEEPPVV